MGRPRAGWTGDLHELTEDRTTCSQAQTLFTHDEDGKFTDYTGLVHVDNLNNVPASSMSFVFVF